MGLAPCSCVTSIAHLFHTEHPPKYTSSAEIVSYFSSVSSPAQRRKQLSCFLPFVDSLKERGGGAHSRAAYKGQEQPFLRQGFFTPHCAPQASQPGDSLIPGPSHCEILATTDVHTGFSTDSEDSKSGTHGCTRDALLLSHSLSPSSCLPICCTPNNNNKTQTNNHARIKKRKA